MYLGNVKIKNPVWMSSSHLTGDIPLIKKAIVRKIGGIVLKGTVSDKETRKCETKCNKCPRNFSGLMRGRFIIQRNNTLYAISPDSPYCEYDSVEETGILLKYLKQNHPNILRISNLCASNIIKGVRLAKQLEELGSQILELNCYKILKYSSKSPQELGHIINFAKKVRKSINIPVIAKLSLELLKQKNIEQLAQHVDGLTIANSLKYKNGTTQYALPRSVINTLPANVKISGVAVSGQAVWGYTKKYVPLAKKYSNFVSASGGVYNVEKAKQIIKLGADTVQLCAGIEFNGYRLIDKIYDSFISLSKPH